MRDHEKARVQEVATLLRKYGDARAHEALRRWLRLYWDAKGTPVLDDGAKLVAHPGAYANTQLARFSTAVVSFNVPADNLEVKIDEVMQQLDALAAAVLQREEVSRETAVYYEELQIGIVQEFYVIRVCCWLTVATQK